VALEASNAGAVFATSLPSIPSSSDEIARMANLPANPLQGAAKTAADKALAAGKDLAVGFLKKTAKGVLSAGAGTLTSLTAGATIGNLIPIPGIGAAIGALGALVFEGFKALGKALLKALKPKPQPYQRKCPQYSCPELPSMSIIEVLPWVSKQQAVVGADYVKQMQKSYCGVGGVDGCLSYLGDIQKAAFKVTVDTIPYLGLPQLDRLLLLYRSAPTQHAYYGAAYGRQAKVSQIPHRELLDCIRLMESRQLKLRELMGRAAQAATLPSNQVPKLRWDLVTELTKAATQVQFAAGPETLGWYNQLGTAVLQLTAREGADDKTRKLQSAADQKKAAQVAADPAKALQLRITQQQFLCSEAGGRGPACDEVRRLRGQTPTRPRQTASVNTAALQQLSRAQEQYVADYLQWLADSGNPAAQLFMADKARQPGVSAYQYLERKSKTGDRNAQIALFAAVKEFRDSLTQKGM